MDFSGMTKARIGAYGAARGVHLDERMRKPDMIAALEAALAERAEASALQAVAQAVSCAAITITDAPMAPVTVAVNSRSLTLPVGVPVTVPRFVLPVLDGAGVRYRED